MAALIQAVDFPRLFRDEVPLLDVRAPVEFARGSFPTATNLPLLNNQEREAVGIRYRQQGRDAAVALGHELVADEEKESRLRGWMDFASNNPGLTLYCYRGGLRSTICQQWLLQAGVEVPRIAGGYKALRRFLIDTIDRAAEKASMVIIAGKTGCGKTHFINSVTNSLDLEACANHRGSAFGRRVLSQPVQIDFENQLATQLLRLDWQEQKRVVLEDESRAIGSLSIPQNFHRRMSESPLALIEESLQQRVNTIHLDYIQSNYQEFKEHYPEQADELFAQSLCDSLARIERRLGGENFHMIQNMLNAALDTQLRSGNIDDHRLWIEALLTHYYDPMYDFQLAKKSDRIVFRGNKDELRNWIQPVIDTSQ